MVHRYANSASVEKFIKDFNDAKKKGEHAYDMTLSYKNFDKGFFNSRFQMQMTFDNGAPDLNIKPARKLYLMWMLSTVRCPSQC